jgi:hypothetical protein
MNRHKGLDWAKVQAKLMLKDGCHSMKWKELAVNRTPAGYSNARRFPLGQACGLDFEPHSDTTL